MPYFRILKGTTQGKLLPLVGDQITLGRSTDCEIVLEVPSVSRRHAQVIMKDSRYCIVDLGSRNGTFVNGYKIAGPTTLEEGDQVQLCDLYMIYHRGDPLENDTSRKFDSHQLNLFAVAPKKPITEALEDSGINLGMEVMSKPLAGGTVINRNSREDDDSPSSGDSRILSNFAQTSQNIRPGEEVDHSSIMSTFMVAPFQPVNQSVGYAEAKLKAILQLMQTLGQSLDQTVVLDKILSSLFTIFAQADHGLIVLRDTNGHLVPKAIKHRQHTAEPIRISKTIFNKVMDTKTAILSADVMEDSRFNDAQSIMDMSIHSMMCAPLIDAECNVLGAIKLDCASQSRRFQQEDLELLASVAVQAALYVRNAQLHDIAVRDATVQQELTLAHKVQQALLPDEEPSIPTYEFFDLYRPARHLGGDYYDYIPLPDGRLAIVQADVAGKGITAALVMAKLSADTKFTLLSVDDPIEAVDKLNHVVGSKNIEGKFITFVLVILNPQTNEVQIVNAGHNAPILRHPGGNITLMTDVGKGMPLGIVEDGEYSLTSLTLQPGDMLVFYTDGLTDAMNPAEEFFSINRVVEKIARPIEQLQKNAQQLITDLMEFISECPQTDDICVVGFQRKE